MSTRPDDWEKPRGRRDHLTPADIAKLERSFRQGRTPRDAAREIKCSSRTAYRYFGNFQGAAPAREIAAPLLSTVAKAPTPNMVGRFYKGSFEL